MSRPDEDPGWRPALPGLAWGLFPRAAIWRAQRGRGDALVALRGVFLSFCAAIVLVGVVVVVLDATGGIGGDLPGGPVASAVAAVGALLLAASAWRRPLDGSSDEALASSYRTRFFLRMAFAESAALLGFVGFVLTGNPAVYLAGAAFTAVGFALLAPSAGNHARDQEELRRAGSPRSLVQALRAAPPGRP